MQPRPIARTLGAALVLASAPLLHAGCLANACLLTVCDGPNCRCSVSTCGDGADFDTRVGRCRCLAGLMAVGGQCFTQQQADAYCGPGYTWQNGGCYGFQCRPGDQLDHATGQCMTPQQVQQVATNLGVAVGPGQTLGCPAGTKLVIDGQAAACVPLSQTCARDETWNGTACVKVAACPTGSAWDATTGQCIQYAQGSTQQGLAVNVGQWAAANYGPDGGNGMPAFCSAFGKKPWSFGINQGSSAMVRVAVMMSFPDGEIAKGVVQTTTVFTSSGNPVPAKGAAQVDEAARQVFKPLVHQGGRPATATASTTVKCMIVNAGRPVPVPATGGL